MAETAEIERLRKELADAERRAEIAEHLIQRTRSITNPKRRKHLTYLRAWLNFLELHLSYFNVAYTLLYEAATLTPRLALEEEGRIVCEEPLTSEKDLEYYDRSAVEEKVKQLLRSLIGLEHAQDLVNSCQEVEFRNHLNALGETPQEEAKLGRLSAVDKAYIYRCTGSARRLLLVREYKPPHKLTSQYLRAGLRPMNVKDEVVQRTTTPTDHGEKMRYHADRLVAAAVTQTFEYMIDNGLEYASIATGTAEVFLRVRQEDPETVYYYLTEPKLDVETGDDFGFRYPFTAVSRLFGFILMAMHSDVRSQAWRHAAVERLNVWMEEVEEVLHNIPDEDRRDSPEGSLYSSPGYPVDPRSPYLTRSRRLLDSTHAEPILGSFESDSSSQSPGEGHLTAGESPSRHAAGKRKRDSTGPHQQSTGRSGTSDSRRTGRYCTLKCLAGIRYQRGLDPACPNFPKHRIVSWSGNHDLDLDGFAQRVRVQLNADMDHHCYPLSIQGSRGVMFEITLVSHGYVFVAKGTVKSYRSDLLHEGSVYRHLFPLQGSTIPVYLGNIDLERPYYYEGGTKLYHMLLMSWGGPSLSAPTPPVSCSVLEEEKRRSFHAISQLSVVHNDRRLSNMLWNEELGRVLVIDFERSRIQRQEKRKRQQLEPRLRHRAFKKRHMSYGSEASAGGIESVALPTQTIVQ